jgi:hypothetical protein
VRMRIRVGMRRERGLGDVLLRLLGESFGLGKGWPL